MVAATLLTVISLCIRGSFSKAKCMEGSSDQCASLTTLEASPALICDATNTCCSCSTITCDQCTGVTLADEGTAIGATINVAGNDMGMVLLINGESAGKEATITGDTFTLVDIDGAMGFMNGILDIRCNDDRNCDIQCSGANSCDGAYIDAELAGSYTASGKDAAQNSVVMFTSPAQGFSINCGADGACQGADIEIFVNDCGSLDDWRVGTIQCRGDNACKGTHFTFVMEDRFCNMQVSAVTCEGTDACKSLRLNTMGNVYFAECSCTTGDCKGAKIIPYSSNNCPEIMDNGPQVVS